MTDSKKFSSDSNRPQNNQQTTGPTTPAITKSPKPKKSRKFRRVIFIVLLLIILTIVVAPWLASTKTGSRTLLNQLNNRLDQNLQIEKISLTWLGPCELNNLRIADQTGRDLFHLTKATWDKGLARAITSPRQFSHISLDQPTALVYVSDSPDKKTDSSDTTPPGKKDSPQINPGILASLTGKLTVRTGGVRFVRQDGRSYQINQINGDFSLDTLNKIQGDCDLTLADGGKIISKFNIDKLITNNQIDLDSANGSVDINSAGDIDLAPLLEFSQTQIEPAETITNNAAPSETTAPQTASTQPSTAATLTQLDLTAKFDSGKIQADLTTKLKQLRVAGKDHLHIQPIDVNIVGKIRGDSASLQADGTIASSAGTLNTTFDYQKSETPIEFPPDLLAQLLTGQVISLPSFNYRTDGQIDIPKLAAAVPALLKIRPDLQITSGQVIIENLTVRGGPQPIATGSVQLTGLSALRLQKTITCEPVIATFDSFMDPKAGFTVRNLKLSSSFATIAAAGTTQKFNGNFQADLDKFHQQTSDFLDLKDFNLAGKLQGQLAVNRTQPDRLGIDLKMTGNNLHYQNEQKQLNIADLAVNYTGYLESPKDQPQKLITTSARANADNQLIAQGSGSYNFQDNAVTAELALEKADLHYLNNSLLPKEKPSDISGSATWQGSIKTEKQLVNLNGTGRIDQLALGKDEKAFRQNQLKLNHQITINPENKTITVNQTQLESQALTADLTGTVKNYHTTADLDLAGRYRGSWEELTRLLHQIAPNTAETITMIGPFDSDFTITGPTKTAQLKPVFASLNAQTNIGWTSGQLYGIAIDRAVLNPTMQNGRILLTDPNIPAGPGFIRPHSLIDLTSDEPILKIPNRVQLLQNVHVNPKIARQLLSHVNPIFANLAEIQGNISLNTTDIVLPLSKNIKTAGSGSGTLKLDKIRIIPAGFFAEILKLSGISNLNQQPMQVNNVDFRIQNGRIHYSNFALNLAGDLDLKFYGSVGFDDTLNLVVSIPITPAFFERSQSNSAANQYASALRGLRVDIPIIGTRLNPKLDFAAVNIDALIKKALDKILRQQTGDVLDQIFKKNSPAPQPAPAPQPPNTPNPTPQPTPQPTTPDQPDQNLEDQILDIFFDIITPPKKTKTKDN